MELKNQMMYEIDDLNHDHKNLFENYRSLPHLDLTSVLFLISLVFLIIVIYLHLNRYIIKNLLIHNCHNFNQDVYDQIPILIFFICHRSMDLLLLIMEC
jgi:hypothetical protein